LICVDQRSADEIRATKTPPLDACPIWSCAGSSPGSRRHRDGRRAAAFERGRPPERHRLRWVGSGGDSRQALDDHLHAKPPSQRERGTGKAGHRSSPSHVARENAPLVQSAGSKADCARAAAWARRSPRGRRTNRFHRFGRQSGRRARLRSPRRRATSELDKGAQPQLLLCPLASASMVACLTLPQSQRHVARRLERSTAKTVQRPMIAPSTTSFIRRRLICRRR
jgi:hypothetical protein